jgi:hypothetical protein
MNNAQLIPSSPLPFWVLFLVTIGGILLAVSIGLRLGKHKGAPRAGMPSTPIPEIVAAMFGLLVFMLGFTFSLAASRFETRRILVVDEANAIGTTWLRAGMLPEPNRAAVRKLLREYLEVRLNAVKPGGDLGQGLARSAELQNQLWAEAEAVAAKNQGSIIVGLFISSLNDVIDLHSKRMTWGLRSRLPASIWETLCVLAICSLGMLGYYAGLADGQLRLAIFPLALVISTVLILIVDLDLPQSGSFRTSQQPLADLLQSLDGMENK